MKYTSSELYFMTYFTIIYLLQFSHTQQYITLKTEYGDLCSPVIKNKIKLGKDEKSALIVTQNRLQYHTSEWKLNFICKFEVDNTARDGGILAVIQYLNLRKDYATEECIDYIQFRPKDGVLGPKYCGLINATTLMNSVPIDDVRPISYGNSFIDHKGELDVYINISRKPLEYTQTVDLNLVFTAYKVCSKNNNRYLRPCSDKSKTICIHKNYFNDQIINCPYTGCTDEGGCLEPNDVSKQSIGNKVLVGSISSLCVMFILFILCVWACRRHRVFCWSEDFAHPTTSTPEENAAPSIGLSRVMETSEQTGARLAVPPATAPVEEDKDLPPSYDSLFPNAR